MTIRKSNCEICHKEIDYLPFELYLDGTDDMYYYDVCEECYEKYGSDYFEPEVVDKLVEGEIKND
jgi:ribosome-binding protein aMBF1 (putative translation factor)